MNIRMLFLVKYIYLITTFSNVVFASAYYCDNDYCNGPDLYCCGHNECCTNVMTMWYFWFALLIGVVITCLLVCKYNNSRVNIISSNDLLPQHQQQQQQQYYKAPHEHYLYKPLRNNNDDYLDHQQKYPSTLNSNTINNIIINKT